MGQAAWLMISVWAGSLELLCNHDVFCLVQMMYKLWVINQDRFAYCNSRSNQVAL